MSKIHDVIDAKLEAFLLAQKVFFVATAPLSSDGLVNLSPKGLSGTFAVLDSRTVAYLDLTGSGIETVAHVRENGRIVLMFTAFEGPPRIVRLYGGGDVVEPQDPEFAELIEHFPQHPGARSIVRVRAHRIADACGFGVPLMEYRGDRSQLTAVAERNGEEGLRAYRAEKNRTSLEGLPGLRGAEA